MDSSNSWLIWWNGRGKHLSTLSNSAPEKLYFGVFLREAETWWRKSSTAISLKFHDQWRRYELQAESVADELFHWWKQRSPNLLSEAQRFVAEFVPTAQDAGTQNVARLFGHLEGIKNWESLPIWDRTRVWTADVAECVASWKMAPLGNAVTPALPFDPGSLPQFTNSKRFVSGALLAGLGLRGGSIGRNDQSLSDESSRLIREMSSNDVAPVAASLAVAIVVNRQEFVPPRTFHEFCMDLAASPLPALRALDLLFTSPTPQRVLAAADWVAFGSWDWSVFGTPTTTDSASNQDLPHFQNKAGFSGWLRECGLLSSKEAFFLAQMVSLACSAISAHLISDGAFTLPTVEASQRNDSGESVPTAGPKQDAPSKPLPQEKPLIKIGQAIRAEGRSVDVPMTVGDVTKPVKERVAKLAEELSARGTVESVVQRTVADLIAAHPELENLLVWSPTGEHGRVRVEAPGLVGRVAKHVDSSL